MDRNQQKFFNDSSFGHIFSYGMASWLSHLPHEWQSDLASLTSFAHLEDHGTHNHHGVISQPHDAYLVS